MAISDYESIRTKLMARPVTIHGTRYYVAETDLLLDDDQVIEHAQMRAAAKLDPDRAPKNHAFIDNRKRLLAVSRGGRIVRWKDGVALTYAIDKRTFANDKYEKVRDDMRDACSAWTGVCGIRFEHRAEHDGAPREVLFTVSLQDTGGELIAAAFFPNDPPKRRHLIIDPSYFGASLSFDTVGVLRHELGHVLGFRHEHIREGAPPDCLREELREERKNTTGVTKYDSKSVMHYLCGGLGDSHLEITDVDRDGAQTIYGPPFGSFELVS